MFLKYITLFLTLLLTLSGCDIFIEWPSSPHSKDIVIIQNDPYHSLFIDDATASCHWDNYYYDYIWEFDLWIDHSYGPREIIDVYVDVWDGGYFVDSFPLYHDFNGHWDSYWIEWSETNLYCGSHYEFEFVAYDWNGHEDYLTVW